MIKFKSVQWCNFLSTGNQPTTIIVDKNPTTLIIGSNGAGKSTFNDALTYALYGKPIRKINLPDLINKINNKNLKVEVEFSVGKNEYKVVRGMKPKLFEIYKNGKIIEEDSDAKDYQKFFENNILGISFKTFTQICILGSSNFIPFMRLTTPDRRDVIENLLDIEIFSKMSDIIKSKHKVLKAEYLELDSRCNRVEDRVDMYRDRFEQARSDVSTFVTSKESKRDEITDELNILTNEVDDLSTQVNNLTLKLVDKPNIENKFNKFNKLEIQIVSRKSSLTERKNFLTVNDNCPTCEQLIDKGFRENSVSNIADDITKIDDGLLSLKEKKSVISDALHTLSDIAEELQDTNIRLNSKNARIREKQLQIGDLNEEITKALSEGESVNEYQNKLKEAETEYQSLLEEKRIYLKDKNVIEHAEQMLKDNGIKTKIIRQYIPVINKHVNKYLDKLNFPVVFELDENFKESIVARYRDDMSYYNLSEGEKSRIDLAMLLLGEMWLG